MRIDLNCDMGESFGRYSLGNDAALLDIVTSANIACGFHAGDPMVMADTVRMAAMKGVAMGAHPGYPDLQGFGRRAMELSSAEISAAILYQIGALAGFTKALSKHLTHVKPHGALYNIAARDKAVAEAVVEAVAAFDQELIIVTLPSSILQEAAERRGLRVVCEGFADRAYQADGSLLPRSQPGAVIHNPDQVAERAVRMVTQQEIQAWSGEIIPLQIDTLCIHGDTPGAALIAQKVRTALEEARIDLAAFTNRF